MCLLQWKESVRYLRPRPPPPGRQTAASCASSSGRKGSVTSVQDLRHLDVRRPHRVPPPVEGKCPLPPSKTSATWTSDGRIVCLLQWKESVRYLRPRPPPPGRQTATSCASSSGRKGSVTSVQDLRQLDQQ